MSKFLRDELRGITPYVPGEQPQEEKIIKLNTNENPYPASPKAREAMAEEERDNRYADPEGREAVKAVAKYYNLQENQVLLGNGSDELLAFSFMAYGKDFYFPNISYGFYPVFAQMFARRFEEIPLSKELKIAPKDYYDKDGTIVLANPNAPTGRALSPEEIEKILERNSKELVIIDEAYVDFGGETVVPLIEKYDNLLVIQTCSKSRGLAAMRIGMAMGNEKVIQDLKTIKYSFNPYNVNGKALVALKASLEDEEYFQKIRRDIIKTREWFVEEMEKIGFPVVPSKANFVFVKGGKEYYQALREKGIVVRHFEKEEIKEYVRITIGTRRDMEKVVKATEEILCERQ